MSSRQLHGGPGPNTLHSEQCRAEIQRFESVHPCIYQIYDMLDYMPQELGQLRDQIRDQVVCIEDAFVNSHEWTLSRSVSELRLGIVGTTTSGKTSLVHRYLTGTCTAEESPEGGRFKKEAVIDGQSHLLLIRDEGNSPPDVQFSLWADAVIFVFSVDNQESFEKIRHYYNLMNKFRNLSADMPLLLVGTKDTVSEKNPRVISEEEGHNMAKLLKRCVYFETQATYGLNVERVFKDACCKILQQRIRASYGSNNRTPTPSTPSSLNSGIEKRDYQDPRYVSSAYGSSQVKNNYHQRSISSVPLVDGFSIGGSRKSHVHQREGTAVMSAQRGGDRSVSAFGVTPGGPSSSSQFTSRASQLDCRGVSPSNSQKSMGSISNGLHSRSSAALLDGPLEHVYQLDTNSAASASTSHLPTPSSTPTTQRKNRRISNIFQRPKDHGEEKTKAIEALNLGVGRAIPIKQGLMYKKSTKSALNREWKKKYVCLYNDGRLTYHHNLKDYMDKSTHGKEVFLGTATVKIAGRQRPRNTQRGMVTSQTEEPTTLRPYESRKSDAGVVGSGEGTSGGGSDDAKDAPVQHTPQTVAGHSKKRRGAHRRLGSSGKHADEDEECFEIVTCDQKRWEFCAASAEERDEWVEAIEEQIEKALQSQLSQPSNRAHGNRDEVLALRHLPGNNRCADCGQMNPCWASLNLGTLICIECSGIHRNLGSHVSRVRSLDLDDWPVEFLAVMQAIGNDAANQLWEHNAPKDKKPQPDSGRDMKESWIRAKYEAKRFLPSLRVDETVSTQLVASVIERNVAEVSLLLTRATPEDVNAPISNKDRRTPLHLACSIGSLEILQLLLWNNADLRALDEQGRSGLWHAQHNGFKDCAEVLLTAGLPADYGMSQTGVIAHVVPEGAIMGSLSNRDYSCIGDDRDVVMRRVPPTAASQGKRATNAFDLLPASII